MSSLQLKLFGAGLLSLSGLLSGYLYARRLRVRRDFLSRLQEFLCALSTAVRYRGEDIFTLVNSSGELFHLSNSGSASFFQEWRDQCAALCRSFRLTRRDMELLEGLGKGLGTTDAQGQLKHIELYRALFEKQREAAFEEAAQKSKLYKALGLFAGVSVSLVIM